MPLTEFQRRLLAVIAATRSPHSYLAGGTALHFAPNSTRYSHDLDIFHDEVRQVAEAFQNDRALLESDGYGLELEISQPGFVRAIVSRDGEATQIDWARDSMWRFMPVAEVEPGGFVLHEIDLATNKVLALAGRDEPRDFVDILYVTQRILTLGPLIWAATAKDPGYSPLSLLEQIKRRGRFRQEEFERLDLVEPMDLAATKAQWIAALEAAERFVSSRPADELGALYYSTSARRFVEPESNRDLDSQQIVLHFGRPGGVLPVLAGRSIP